MFTQNPLCDSSNTKGLIIFNSGITVLVNDLADTDPVCIRCGTFGQLYTDPNEVSYIIDGQSQLAFLIVFDPANTFLIESKHHVLLPSQSIDNVFTFDFLICAVHYSIMLQ